MRFFLSCVLKVTQRGGSKGKGTNDPLKFLPVPPSKRSKPSWQVNPPSFLLSGKVEDGMLQDGNGIDLITELTASRWKLNSFLKSSVFVKLTLKNMTVGWSDLDLAKVN